MDHLSIGRLYKVMQVFDVGIKVALTVSYVGNHREGIPLASLNEAGVLPDYIRSVRDIGPNVKNFINAEPNKATVKYRNARLGTLLTLTPMGKSLYDHLKEVK